MMTLACPRCHTSLDDVDSMTKRCVKDGLTFHQKDGIWRMLLPGREEYFARFIRDYETVRRSEGRGSADASYYRALPYHQSTDWRIRAASFDAFLRKVIIPGEENSKSLRILDLGAGNGWRSSRLAARGHDLAALDLMTNNFDGLGCYRFYESTFLPVQAEFDHLPFSEKEADIVLFNASFHYSVDIKGTLAEALRVLHKSGKIIILDSPVYHNPESGTQMVHEREAHFTKQYGFASNRLQSENYLSYGRLNELARELNLVWKFITPFYNLQWTLRPLLAFLLHHREPAKFHVIVGKRKYPDARRE
ncbi:MAG: methyltransferase domain-containing protein [Anaerolineales bacterium]